MSVPLTKVILSSRSGQVSPFWSPAHVVVLDHHDLLVGAGLPQLVRAVADHQLFSQSFWSVS